MKIQLQIRVLLFALLTMFSALGQSYRNVEIRPRTSLIEKSQLLNPMSIEFIRNNKKQRLNNSRNVHIRQVGYYNQFTSNVRSAASDILLYQIGNRNQTFLQRSSLTIDEQILQRGNNNTFYDIGKNWTLYHKGQVYQQGNNQRLLFIGSNSLSERIMVSMRGNNQTVIIRNINRK
jgi:hypothetical protein